MHFFRCVQPHRPQHDLTQPRTTSQRFRRHHEDIKRLKPVRFAGSQSHPDLFFFLAFIICNSCVSVNPSGRRLGHMIPSAYCSWRRGQHLGLAPVDMDVTCHLFIATTALHSILRSPRSCRPCWLPHLALLVGASRAVSRLSERFSIAELSAREEATKKGKAKFPSSSPLSELLVHPRAGLRSQGQICFA